MKYDFDRIIDRRGTGAIKTDVLKERYGRDDLTALWVADMDFETPEFITEALKERLEHSLDGYTTQPEEYWPTVMKWIEDHHQWKVEREWLTYIPGIVKGIGMAINALLGKHDKVIIQPPVYHPFRLVPQGNKREIVYNPLHENEDGTYSMDFENLKAVCDDKCRMLILANPHNPAGIVWPRDTLERLASFCHRRGIIVISDEIHCDLIRTGYTHTPLLKLCPEYKHRIIACTAPSKTFNMAGMQMSNIIIPNEEYRQKWYGYTMGELSISSPSPFGIVAMHAAYNEGEDWLNQVNAYLDENVAFMKAYLAEHLPEAHMAESQGTYLVWVDVNAYCSDAKELERLMLEEAGVYFDEGYIFGPGGSGFERFNIACPRSILEKSLERMSAVLKKYARK